MRIIVFLIIALFQLAAAAVGFFMLLMGLNGFNEREATPGLALYIVLGVGSAVGLGLAGAFTAKALVTRKALGGFAASAISVVAFSGAGVVVLVVGFILGALVASAMHEMR